MKKIFMLLIAVIITAALASGCKSSSSVSNQPFPAWANELPPSDSFWGIGTAKLQNDELAMNVAMSRARRDIATQISVVVQSMLTDYARESGTLNDTASIQSIERVSQELINVNLAGVSRNAMERMSDGTWWIRATMSKTDAQRVVNEAFATEASRYADFRASEATRMLERRLAETQSTPTPRMSD